MSSRVEIDDRSALPRLRIAPSRGWVSLKLSELWEYRELLYFLVWRDIKVRYKQTALGASWAIIQPFMTMVVFSLFFGHLARMPSDGLPYPIFTFAALVPWTLFATPIAYPSSLLREPWRTIYGLNPMVGVVEGFRWALLRTSTVPGPIVAVSASAAVLILVTGAFYFRRMEKTFADIV